MAVLTVIDCVQHRYEKKDLVLDAVFDNTLSPSGYRRNPHQLQADHSKLDSYTLEDADQLSRMSRRVTARSGPRLSVPTFGIEQSLSRMGSKLRRRVSSEDYSAPAAKAAEAEQKTAVADSQPPGMQVV